MPESSAPPRKEASKQTPPACEGERKHKIQRRAASERERR